MQVSNLAGLPAQVLFFLTSPQTVFQKVGPSEVVPSHRGSLSIALDQELRLRVRLLESTSGFYHLLAVCP